MIKVGVVGGTGYTGVELLRLLVQHPEVNLAYVTSRSEAGQMISEHYPNLRGRLDLKFTEPNIDELSTCDVVFFATPNGIAMKSTPALLEAGVRVIDIAADFRLKDLTTWEEWYGMKHACPELIEEAVYGLPEFNRSEIKNARIVACAGCYTTASQLALMPLLKSGKIKSDYIIVDGKSGVSGAGRTLKTTSLFSESSANFSAYAVSGHRHQPEIVESLKHYTGTEIGLTFVPHLVPMVRGIFVSAYLRLSEDMTLDEIQQCYQSSYDNEQFVDVMPAGSHPETKHVTASNMCRLAVHKPSKDSVVILSVIDNLVKGASGQAVQNMNIMFGFDESLALEAVPLAP